MSAPRLKRGVKLTHDAARGSWVLLAPERVLVLDEIAHAILSRCDGRDMDAICDDLAAAYDAPRDEIAADVETLLADLAAKGYVER